MPTNVTEALCNGLLQVSLSITRESMSQSDKSARALIARHTGTDEAMWRATKSLLPVEYGEEFRAVGTLLSKLSKAFAAETLPMSRQPNGRAGKTRAILASPASVADFMAKFGPGGNWEQAVTQARDALVASWPHTLRQLANDPRFNAGFNPADYPSADDLDASFRFAIEGPTPIAAGFDYLPLPPTLAFQLEEKHAADLTSAVKFGQQQIAIEAVQRVQHAAERAAALLEYDGNGRRPALYDVVFEDLRASSDSLRKYALPETTAGAALMDIAERIDALLREVPDAATAKHSADAQREVVAHAADLSAAVEELDILWN
jgi:hypothetical protein